MERYWGRADGREQSASPRHLLDHLEHGLAVFQIHRARHAAGQYECRWSAGDVFQFEVGHNADAVRPSHQLPGKTRQAEVEAKSPEKVGWSQSLDLLEPLGQNHDQNVFCHLAPFSLVSISFLSGSERKPAPFTDSLALS